MDKKFALKGVHPNESLEITRLFPSASGRHARGGLWQFLTDACPHANANSA
jgi:hypothetical protein